MGFLSEHHETLYSPKQEICRKSKKFSNVGLVPDLTKEQSKDEDEMIKEVEKIMINLVSRM